MSPRSLLFSSDQETSRQLSLAFHDLGLSVEAYPEIFAALKSVTGKTFHVIAVDWDEGLEAGFLLKTARELRSNYNLFAIVIGKTEARAALERAGADLVLSKPLQSDRIKHSLLSCNGFTSRIKPSLPQGVLTTGFHEQRARTAQSLPRAVPGWPAPVSISASTAASSHPDEKQSPSAPSFATFENGIAGESFLGKWFQTKSRAGVPFPLGNTMRHNVLLRSMAMGVIFFVVGYILSQPLSQASFAVTQAVDGWFGPSPEHSAVQTAVSAPQQVTPPGMDATERHGKTGRIRVVPVHDTAERREDLGKPERVAATPAIPDTAAASAETSVAVSPARKVQVPESIDEPFPGVTAVREVADKQRPTLMEALQPVTIPASLSEKLLVEKTPPSYPESALQAGLRGPVVLQAWIGKDGRIQELKLIRGPLLLGQAAFDAVRNWRFKPYLLNGEAVEAQTLVTVDFKLP